MINTRIAREAEGLLARIAASRSTAPEPDHRAAIGRPLARMLVYVGGALKAAGAPEEVLEHLRAVFRWVSK